MPKWKNIAGLSEQEEKAREAAFEAQMLAMIAPTRSQPPVAPSAPPTMASPSPTGLLRDGIQISVTDDRQTTLYNNLETVPWPVRQRIMDAWRPSSAPSTPPIASAPSIRSEPPSPPLRRPKSMRVAMSLNLLLPGAGQFYFGQPVMGSVYAAAFIASFAPMLALFVRGYFAYLRLSTNGDILETGNLEQLTHVFPVGLLGGLSVAGIAIYLASAIHLVVSRPRK